MSRISPGPGSPPDRGQPLRRTAHFPAPPFACSPGKLRRGAALKNGRGAVRASHRTRCTDAPTHALPWQVSRDLRPPHQTSRHTKHAKHSGFCVCHRHTPVHNWSLLLPDGSETRFPRQRPSRKPGEFTPGCQPEDKTRGGRIESLERSCRLLLVIIPDLNRRPSRSLAEIARLVVARNSGLSRTLSPARHFLLKQERVL